MSRNLTWLTRLGSRLANRRFIFTLVALAVCGAKGTHLHNHRLSVAPKRMLLFFFSFFTQDILLLLSIRLLLGHWLPSVPGKLRLLVTTLTGCLISYNVVLGIISVTFYIVAGSEIHWRNIGFAADPTSRAILLSGLMTLMVVMFFFVLLSGLLQGACYGLFGIGADLVNWPVAFVGRKLDPYISFRNSYDLIPQRYGRHRPSDRFTKDDDDSSLESYLGYNEKPKSSSLPSPPPSRGFNTREVPGWPSIKCILHALPYIVVTILLTALFTLTLLRPKDSSLIFLSWTSGLLPFIDFASTSPFLDDLPSYFGNSIQRGWDERSALTQTTPFSWLPEGTPPVGFEDWYTNQTHYDATADLLKISNLDEPLLESLRGKLGDISVRHVMLFLLESTRNDVFPIKKNGLVWNRFAETFPDHQLPQEAHVHAVNTSS